ncbi:MAG TPA: S53 family peptidase [Trebonia sp.]|nr:S53 family peptidase [Trebonia sp.]
MAFSVRSRLWAGLATASAAQAATAPGPSTPEKVPTGLLASALPGASAFGDTSPSTPEQVSFVLKERDVSALESAVTGGLSRYDSVSQFAAKYGQAPDVVSSLTSYLAKFGIKTAVYPGNVDVSASGTAGQFDRALTVKQENYHVPAQHGSGGGHVPAQTVYSATGEPELPYGISRYVLAILGLTNYAPFVSHAVHLNPATTLKPASSAAGTPGSYLPSNFAANYGLTSLAKKANGSGETLGIVTLAALDEGAPEYFWQNVAKVPATGRTVTVDNVDGGPGAPSDAAGTGETDLDVEQSGGVAPGANVIVYQAPNSDPGFLDAFFSAASQNVAGTVSSSWGESETVVAAAVAAGQETATYEAAFDEAFLELADQGQSTFVSAGDAGAYDASEDLGTTNLSVDTPGDSPYVTSAGGTTLPWSGTVTGPDGSAAVSVKRQRAWGWDYLWAPIASVTGTSYAATATANVVGGGGGFAAAEPEPSYQKLVSGSSVYRAVQYLTPTGFQPVVPGTDFVEPTSWTVTSSPSLVSGSGSGRAEPDVSADADPYSGYLLYEPSAVAAGGQALEGGWGGTSFVAPQFNGSAAVIDSYLGHRVGLWNPSLYSFASGSGSPVTPLSQASSGNDNIFYTGSPGDRYNEATGLGVPDLAKFASDLARG